MADAAIASRTRIDFRRVEFFAFSLTAFAGKSLLLVRLPYREPDVNALYTVLLLVMFYCYFRFRYKITPPAIVVLFLGAAVAVDVLGNAFQLYGKEFGPVQYDEFSHFTGSGFSLVPAMWLLRATTRRFGLRLPLDFLAFLSVAITFSFCSYYEILELWDERYWGGKRLWTPIDSANDLQWDLAGIIVAAVLTAVVIKLSDRRTLAQLELEAAPR
jgi:uncharacterized membrane protein YjdF